MTHKLPLTSAQLTILAREEAAFQAALARRNLVLESAAAALMVTGTVVGVEDGHLLIDDGQPDANGQEATQ